MAIAPIRPLWDTMPLTRESKTAGETGAGESFTDIFQDAIQNVRDTDREAVEMEYLLSTGQLDNPAELSLALYKANVSVNLLVTLRDQAMEAYNKLSTMSV